MTYSHAATAREQRAPGAGACPFAGASAPLDRRTRLVPPKRQRLRSEYLTGESGAEELHLYYGEKELIFDEPELFAFGTALTEQGEFTAEEATSWGTGYTWSRIEPLLVALLEAGILSRAERVSNAASGVVPSVLPRPTGNVPRSWLECEALTRELSGRSVELTYLELLVPLYRIAHPVLDSEGRQLGEANVFPPALRLDIETEWRACQYPGSRFQDDCPMNVSALKSMIRCWKPMLNVIHRIRTAYVSWFPEARAGLNVGHLERLCNLILAVPTYLLMNERQPVANGALDPLLSCMFRVTDGVRMTAHFMLVRPTEKPPLEPATPVNAREVYAYAEKTAAFLSLYGVCAGPRPMIEELLALIVDGTLNSAVESASVDPRIERKIAELDPAFEYGLLALEAYAVSLSLWPRIAEAYERVLGVVERLPDERSQVLRAFRNLLRERVAYLREHTALGTDAERSVYDRAYADLYQHAERGLAVRRSGGGPLFAATLDERLQPSSAAERSELERELETLLAERFSKGQHAGLRELARTLAGVLAAEQAIVRAGAEIQLEIQRLLAREPARRELSAADIASHQYLFENQTPFPYLADDLERELGIRVDVTRARVRVAGVEMRARVSPCA